MQRAIEAAGIPTIAIANLRNVVERVKYPRAVIVKFPRGATVGPPGDVPLQTQIIRDALDWLESASEPGAFLDLPHRWPGTRKAS